MTDQDLCNLAAGLYPEKSPQECFNFWVQNMASHNKTSTDEVCKLAIVKEESLFYTGPFYDFS